MCSASYIWEACGWLDLFSTVGKFVRYVELVFTFTQVTKWCHSISLTTWKIWNIRFWATVTSNGSPYAMRPLSCQSCLPVCLSVTLVYCGQMVGWIKMLLRMEVGLGPGHIVLHGDPAPPTERGTAVTTFSAHVYCGQTVAHFIWVLVMFFSSHPLSVIKLYAWHSFTIFYTLKMNWIEPFFIARQHSRAMQSAIMGFPLICLSVCHTLMKQPNHSIVNQC